MKLKNFFLFLCFIIVLSLIFLSCKEEEFAVRTSQTITSGGEISTDTEQNSSTLDQMIGEMIILGFRGTEVDSSSGIIQEVKVYEQAGSFIDAMHKYDIITAIKHFPGHGSSTEDSHLGLVDIADTFNEEAELLPYRKLIEDSKADIVMTVKCKNNFYFLYCRNIILSRQKTFRN